MSASDVPFMTEDRAQYTLKVEGYTANEREDMNSDVNMIAPFFSAPLTCG